MRWLNKVLTVKYTVWPLVHIHPRFPPLETAISWGGGVTGDVVENNVMTVECFQRPEELGGELISPEVERLNKGLNAVWSPTPSGVTAETATDAYAATKTGRLADGRVEWQRGWGE
eukprot:1189240-Prorocentrum_minimum.AAC.1